MSVPLTVINREISSLAQPVLPVDHRPDGGPGVAA